MLSSLNKTQEQKMRSFDNNIYNVEKYNTRDKLYFSKMVQNITSYITILLNIDPIISYYYKDKHKSIISGNLWEMKCVKY